MRTIKFRGKRLDNGEWVYGGIHHASGDAVTIIEPIDRDEISVAHRLVEASTVGQFTGLLDKTGKEIWEGDICRTYDWHKNEDGSTTLSEKNKYYYNVVIEYKIGKIWTGYTVHSWYEVIGNIHDNPDLLQP